MRTITWPLVICVLQAISVCALNNLDEVFSYNLTIPSTVKKLLGYSPESYLYFTNLAQSYGYKAMQYKVTTDDGYILTLFRMQSTKCRKLKEVPLLLMHGIFTNGETWLVSGPKLGLPYLMADACYDVWVGNSRGTDHGREHIELHPDRDAKFWDFSIHEMGVYDQPAIIDFIIKTTKVKKINHIGFSSGGGQLVVTTSERPEYSDKINFAIGLSPNLKFKHLESLIFNVIFRGVAALEPVLKAVRIYELFSKGSILQVLGDVLCRDLTLTRPICELLIELDSFHPEYLTDDTYRALYSKIFMGASVKTIIHNNQILNSGLFRQYDYGTEENLLRYNSGSPPLYKVENFEAPYLMTRGIDDNIIKHIDLYEMAIKFPNLIKYKNITVGEWNHSNVFGHKDWPIVFDDLNRNYLKKYSSL